MQKYYSEIIGMPVFSQLEQKELASVQDLIIDPNNGQLLALVVEKGGFLRKTLIVASVDIVKFSNRIEIPQAKNIISIEEMANCKEIWNKKIRIIGVKVVTSEKKPIGVATDYAIETTTNFMVKLIVGPSLRMPMAKKRVIPFEAIQSITREKIVVTSDLEISGATYAKPA